jgi:predicted ATPase
MALEGNGGSPIRTPDQRLRVFVSSTLVELAEERAAVRRAIVSLGLSPVMFELGARPHPPQELYLAQSDIFIGLYWQSYGWVGPGMDISGLEDEFRLAASRPRLLYLKAPAADRQPRLTAMIDELRSQGSDAYRTFRSPRELGKLVRDDLAILLSERFVVSAVETRAAPAGTSPRRTIPVTSTSLIGRESDVAAVADLLARPDVRLVTLTGPGGIGKTRLAIAVTEELTSQGPVPVSFVSLEALRAASDVIPRIAAEAGVVLEGTRSARDALVEHLAEQAAVLVLDNLEQVADIAPEIDDLLAHCAGLKILATSRTVLRLRAEHEYVVAGLPTGSGADGPADSDLAAVRLFVDRADAVRRGIPWTPADIAAVREICRRLDGVPLAIELAAARSRLLDPSRLLSRLESVLDALGKGPVDLPERQRTLRATVEWSVGLLTDAERRLLAVLSVFASGWGTDSAAVVSGESEFDTLDALDVLAGHSLVSVDASGPEPRFRMLATVREFAAERLAAEPDHQDVARRHAEYFAGLIDTDDVPADLTTPWADRLRIEEENVRAAIEWFFRNDPARLPHLLRSLWLYWQVNDRLVEGRQWVTELEEVAATLHLDERARAEVLFTQAVTAVAVGDDSGAIAAVEAIPSMIPVVDEPTLRSALQLAVSWSLPILDDFEGALDAATAAYDGFSERGEDFVAFAALTVGMLETALGRDDRGRRFLREADELGTAFGNRSLTSSARTQLAILDVRAGELDAAKAHLRACLDEIGDDQVGTIIACFVLIAFAELRTAEANPSEAATALGAVKGLRARAGLSAWPIARRGEADLRRRVAELLEPDGTHDAHEVGAELRAHDALALVRFGVV